jgi:hypothetical protein
MTPRLLLLAYIASVNASASQLSHVQPMTVQDVYALVTLMGLYLSEASGHQKAYKELLAHIDVFGDHNPSSIFMCCVIYDLEGSNDAYPQDANLTLVGEIYFP